MPARWTKSANAFHSPSCPNASIIVTSWTRQERTGTHLAGALKALKLGACCGARVLLPESSELRVPSRCLDYSRSAPLHAVPIAATSSRDNARDCAFARSGDPMRGSSASFMYRRLPQVRPSGYSLVTSILI